MCNEIGILEGGNLEYEVTIVGNDELIDLARGLDAMRCAFRSQSEQERQITLSNHRMVTEMSHDLRTPLTSIMIYTELLRQHKFDGPEKMDEYIDKIDKKAHLMKQLSDRLFEYALVTSKTEVDLEAPILFQEAFYDVFSETTAYLEQNGFETALELAWKPRKIRVCSGYISRIFDNLTSNLLKNAAPYGPIEIRTIYQNGFVGFSFSNGKLKREHKEDSSKIGLQNIKNMMRKMDGTCAVTETESRFEITLMFPQVPYGSAQD